MPESSPVESPRTSVAQHNVESAVGGTFEVVQAANVTEIVQYVGEAQFVGGDFVVQVDIEDFVGVGKRFSIFVRLLLNS